MKTLVLAAREEKECLASLGPGNFYVLTTYIILSCQLANELLSTALAKVVFFGIALTISLIGDWWYGLVFWIVPYLTWFQFVLRVRNIAEHGATEISQDPFKNVRTTRAGPIAKTFIAPYWVNYHLEHHMVMHVPCWRLPRLHDMLIEKGLGGKMNVAPSYRAALAEAGWR